MQILRPGDRFVDVGANIGMITLLAARLVGPQGIVDAIEPHPDCCDRIQAQCRMNSIQNVRLERVALSDLCGAMTLNVVTEHTGMSTLANVAGADAELVSRRFDVSAVRGDDVLGKNAHHVALVKLDVEGFETRAIRGLERTLTNTRAMVVTEVLPEWLERAGSSTHELFALMRGLGYQSFELTTRRRCLRHHLALIGVEHPSELKRANVLWLPESGPRVEILGRFVCRR
jgi:FkbM family methyltransferase